eukprot:3041604-Rhodomonas_salina.1
MTPLGVAPRSSQAQTVQAHLSQSHTHAPGQSHSHQTHKRGRRPSDEGSMEGVGAREGDSMFVRRRGLSEPRRNLGGPGSIFCTALRVATKCPVLTWARGLRRREARTERVEGVGGRRRRRAGWDAGVVLS